MIEYLLLIPLAVLLGFLLPICFGHTNEHSSEHTISFKCKWFPDCLYHEINQWSFLLEAQNWIDFHFIELYIEKDGVLEAYEFIVVLLGIGFRIRLNTATGVEQMDYWMKQVMKEREEEKHE